MHDTDPAPVEHERGAEQGVESLGPEDRADHLGLAHVLDDHGRVARRDPAGDPAAKRDPHVELHLFLEPVGGLHGEFRPFLVQQEDHHGVGRHGLTHPPQELREEVVEKQVGERGVRHALHGPDLMRRRLEGQARALLAGRERLGAGLRAAEQAAHDADDQRLHHEDTEARDDRRAQRRAVGARSDERAHPDESAHHRGQEPGAEPPVPRAEHHRAEIEREVSPVDVGLERVGQEPGDGRGDGGERVRPENLPDPAGRRAGLQGRRRVYRGT